MKDRQYIRIKLVKGNGITEAWIDCSCPLKRCTGRKALDHISAQCVMMRTEEALGSMVIHNDLMEAD